MPVTNPFGGADYEAGVNQSTVEGTVTQGSSSASTAFGSGQVPTVGGAGGGFSFGAGGLGSLGSGIAKGASTAFDLLNPSNARKAISGLLSGGASSAAKAVPNIGFQGASAPEGATAAAEDDWRVRVSLADGADILYKTAGSAPGEIDTQNQLLLPLKETNGVIWPYTPTITVTHNANYSSATLTHSNYPAHFYNYSEVADIQISGEFTVQNAEDGQYLMAAVYFFRAATKMFFGSGANMGNPPPIVFLDGYGSHYFPHVPCVVTSFQHSLSPDVDYVEIPINKNVLTETTVAPPASGTNSTPNLTPEMQQFIPNWNLVGAAGNESAAAKLAQNNAAAATTQYSYKTITSHTRVPTLSTVTVTLKPMYSRKNVHERFNLEQFAAGGLLGDKDKGFGGFI